MKKPNIKKLKYPLWFTITFYILTVILPIVLVMVEGYKSPDIAFRWTFGIISGLLILWVFVYKFLISNKEKQMVDKKSQLEHEYEIEVGNSKSIKWLWFSNEQKLAIFNAVQVLLFGSFLAVIAIGISSGFMQIKAVVIMISICYIFSYVLKFILISILKDKQEEDDLLEQ